MTTAGRMSDPFGIEGSNLFEYWVSFWPVAPYFGVEWRFAPLFEPVADLADAAERGLDTALSTAGNRFDKAMKSGEAAIKAVAAATTEQAAAMIEDAADLARPEPAPVAAPAAADDLKLIKGIGPKLERELNRLGVRRFAQIASFGPADLARIDDALTTFKGRALRDDWVAQARALLG